MVIGIDLGTTFSAVATVNDNGTAEVLVNRDGERTTPSVVMFEDGAVVIGSQAKDNSIVDPYSVCQFVKRQMGKKSFSFDVSLDEKYTSEEISSLILKRLKEDAEAATGKTCDGAVITVPAYFDEAQRKATQDAGEIAGLNVLGIINEPTAAAIAYCHGIADTDGIVMVYDLGGGTFDITVMRLSDNLGKVDILSSTGDRNLGGFDFDNKIISKVTEEFQKEHGLDLDDDDAAMQDLRNKAENAKKALSNRPKASISVASQGKTIKVDITREEFDEMIGGFLDHTKTRMDLALDEASLSWSDISKILLVGGSTRVPAVQEMIKAHTGIDPSHELNPDEAVAIGAAYYADQQGAESTGEAPKAKKEIQVTDVSAHSIGVIALNDGTNRMEMFPVIEKNTPLPAIGSKTFFTTSEGQTRLDLQVAEGEDPDPEWDLIIGTTEMRLNMRPQGSPIEVIMNYDINGIIHVRVIDGVDQSDLGEMPIVRESNLTEEEVEEKKGIISGVTIE